MPGRGGDLQVDPSPPANPPPLSPCPFFPLVVANCSCTDQEGADLQVDHRRRSPWCLVTAAAAGPAPRAGARRSARRARGSSSGRTAITVAVMLFLLLLLLLLLLFNVSIATDLVNDHLLHHLLVHDALEHHRLGLGAARPCCMYYNIL